MLWCQCPSVCDGSELWSRCMPGRGEGSSRAMLATARPSCVTMFLTVDNRINNCRNAAIGYCTNFSVDSSNGFLLECGHTDTCSHRYHDHHAFGWFGVGKDKRIQQTLLDVLPNNKDMLYCILHPRTPFMKGLSTLGASHSLGQDPPIPCISGSTQHFSNAAAVASHCHRTHRKDIIHITVNMQHTAVHYAAYEGEPKPHLRCTKIWWSSVVWFSTHASGHTYAQTYQNTRITHCAGARPCCTYSIRGLLLPTEFHVHSVSWSVHPTIGNDSELLKKSRVDYMVWWVVPRNHRL